MRKLIFTLFFFLTSMLCFNACKKDSTFSIQFIDVGQGDSALVECDGHYLLIDGGPQSAGDKVYNVLRDKKIKKLDYLAISHFDADHIGGLKKALTYASSIGTTIANSTSPNDKPDESVSVDSDDSMSRNSELFSEINHCILANGSKISIPKVGDTFDLESAKIEVVDVSAARRNDSLVLLITYGKTRFLFTGDIEENAQTRISERYYNESDKEYKIDLMKVPHHGATAYTLNRFIRTFMPTYAIISVGENQYHHPTEDTLSKLRDADVKVFRTDQNGDIFVTSDGKKISIRTSK